MIQKNTLILSKTNFGGFLLPCIPTLYNYTGQIYSETEGLPHPGALINGALSKLNDSIKSFFQAYNAYIDAGGLSPPNHGQSAAGGLLAGLTKSYEDVLYAATELNERMLKKLKLCILPPNRINEWNPNIIDRWRSHCSAMCNAIKHNHNSLVNVQAIYRFGSVVGYALCRTEGDKIRPNPNVHKAQEAFAFGSDLRKILAHAYLIADAVNNEFQRLLGTVELVDVSRFPGADYGLLNQVANFMPLSFHDQRSEHTATFNIAEGSLTISDAGGLILPHGGTDASVSSVYSGDGFARSFHIFYHKPERQGTRVADHIKSVRPNHLAMNAITPQILMKLGL